MGLAQGRGYIYSVTVGVWGRTTNEDWREVSTSLTLLPQTRPGPEPEFSVAGRKEKSGATSP